MENHHFNGKTHYKWPFSITTLNYQRVTYLDDEVAHPTWRVCDCLKLIQSDRVLSSNFGKAGLSGVETMAALEEKNGADE